MQAIIGLLAQSLLGAPAPTTGMGWSEYVCLHVDLKSTSQECYILFVAGSQGCGKVGRQDTLDAGNGHLPEGSGKAGMTKQTPHPEPSRQVLSEFPPWVGACCEGQHLLSSSQRLSLSLWKKLLFLSPERPQRGLCNLHLVEGTCSLGTLPGGEGYGRTL